MDIIYLHDTPDGKIWIQKPKSELDVEYVSGELYKERIGDINTLRARIAQLEEKAKIVVDTFDYHVAEGHKNILNIRLELLDLAHAVHEKEALEGGEVSSKEPDNYKQARGVIPWSEGDERPEDIIRRGRGGQ